MLDVVEVNIELYIYIRQLILRGVTGFLLSIMRRALHWLQAKRSGNYRNAEFFASRLAIRRRSREFFQTALGFVEETARCADIYLGVPKPKLAPPFERYNDRSFACPARPRYHGSGRIEGYWDVLFCEPCVTPRREVDKRISRRRLQDALHIDASH